MTKHSELKRAARAYQAAHPGMRLADAIRAVARPEASDRRRWTPTATPWLRTPGSGPADCYFCGQDTAIWSATDMPNDSGRVAVYCENPDCDAREAEVLVVDDGTDATPKRTDVRILAHYPPAPPQKPIFGPGPGAAWAAGTTPALRTTTEPLSCLFCGEDTCTVSRNDIAADNGRLRVHCTNARCAMREAEVLIMRDGTTGPQSRQDVKALRGLFVSRADQMAAQLPPGKPRVFPARDWAEPADGADPLQMRTAGPVPWGEPEGE